MPNEDAMIDLANDRVMRVRRKWMQEGRPQEHMARQLIVHGCYWLAELKGEATVAAVLEIWAETIRKQMSEAPGGGPRPQSWWSRLVFWKGQSNG